MLAESEDLREYRKRLRQRISLALATLDRVLTATKSSDRKLRAALWVLENTQVGIKKGEEEVTHLPVGPLQDLSDRELDELIDQGHERLAKLTGSKLS